MQQKCKGRITNINTKFLGRKNKYQGHEQQTCKGGIKTSIDIILVADLLYSQQCCSGYKFYFHLLGSTGSQLDVAQPRALTLSLEEYTTINYSHFCPSVRVVMSSISLLHVPSFLSHFLAICVSSLDLDFSPSFSILSPS